MIPYRQSAIMSSETQTPIQDYKDIETQTQNIINLGPLPTKYLPYATDDKFGLYPKDKGYKIGKLPVLIDGDDIIITNKRIKGTEGLWRLLCYNTPPDSKDYTPDDLKIYGKILFITDSIFQNNDKVSGKPKSSTGLKYINIIKPIWKKHRSLPTPKKKSMSMDNRSLTWDHTADLGETPKIGKGIKKYTENPIEYKYINNLNELLKRLYYIYAQEKAGNNNFHNEKLGVIHFVAKELEKIIDSEKGIEYLISYVSSLPKKVIKGSGLMNDIINNLPFELHWPGYNYLGPGTKLDKRLLKNDKPINKLDEAAQEHDIFYKNNKNLQERHKADEILENKAWERVFDPNANFSEKIPAWVTTSTMKVKRHFGMGLK